MSDSGAATSSVEVRKSAILALCLLVPVPSIGILGSTYGGGPWVWAASKAWLLTFPVCWWIWRDRGVVSWSPPRNGGLMTGLGSGIAIGLFVLMGYWLLGRVLIDDTSEVSQLLAKNRISSPAKYIGLALYLTLINAITEEYVWRWFVFAKCEVLTGRAKSVLLSAFFFSIHHFVVLVIYFDVLPALIATSGVFVGGVIWSWLYLKYRSIWPSYISHIGADVAVFYAGWDLLGY
ncbi:MAG: CPBP family intramembrane glutamic endopeptidase [Planctomycetota bacterium]